MSCNACVLLHFSKQKMLVWNVIRWLVRICCSNIDMKVSRAWRYQSVEIIVNFHMKYQNIVIWNLIKCDHSNISIMLKAMDFDCQNIWLYKTNSIFNQVSIWKPSNKAIKLKLVVFSITHKVQLAFFRISISTKRECNQ